MASTPLTKRVFGKVDEYGGELAASTFVHLFRLPLIPTGSVWLTADDDGFRAQPIKLHLRSVVAAYLRTWVPLLWWFAFSVDSTLGYAVAAAALAACCWTWTWRMTHRLNVQRQNDFDLVALGTQCPPQRMPANDLHQLLTQQKANFARVTTERNPDDIARFGSSNADELLAAYGLLRLHGTLTPMSASDARFAAMRILNGRHEPANSEHGVFRSTADRLAGDVLGPDQLAANVAVQANKLRSATVLRAQHAPKTFVQKVMWGGAHQLVGYAVLALGLFGGTIGMLGVRDPDTYDFVSERTLRNTIGNGKTQYRIVCEEWIEFAKASDIDDDVGDVRLCRVGKKLLPVLSKNGEGIHGNTVRGRLQPRHVMRVNAAWEQQLVADGRLDAQTFQVYLVTDVLSHVGQIVLAGTCMLGSLGLCVMWIRVRRQRRKLLADALAA
jgi:hypothetical protein